MSSSLRYQESRVTRVTRVWGRSARVLTCIAGKSQMVKQAKKHEHAEANKQAIKPCKKYGLSPLVLCWGMDNTGGFWYVGRRLKSLERLYTSLKFFLQTKKTSQFH